MEEEFKKQINGAIQSLNGFFVGFDQFLSSIELKDPNAIASLYRQWEMGLRLFPLSFEAVLRKIADFHQVCQLEVAKAKQLEETTKKAAETSVEAQVVPA